MSLCLGLAPLAAKSDDELISEYVYFKKQVPECSADMFWYRRRLPRLAGLELIGLDISRPRLVCRSYVAVV